MHADTHSKLPELQRFCAYLPKGAAVLDAGAGEGHDARWLAEQGYHVTAIDTTLTMTSPNITAMQSSLTNIPLRDASHQGIWCAQVLPHLTPEELPLALTECYRILKPLGILYCTYKLPPPRQKPSALHVYTEHELTSMLTKAGFTIHEASPDKHDPSWIHVFARKK